MKKQSLLYVISLIVVLVFLGFKNKKEFESFTNFEQITVVELFTSQGCSSCPSADRLLSQTIFDAVKQSKKIFALSFHVDYWNRLGWADPFSSKQFSERQANYVNAFNINGAYTPQMVVNGKYQFTGSDKHTLQKYITTEQSTKAMVAFKTLETIKKDNGSIDVKYLLEGDVRFSNINVAIVSAKEISFIKRGENEGITLVNENVVLNFITRKAKLDDIIRINTKDITTTNKMCIIAYVQHESNYNIIGAASIPLK